MTTEHVAPSSRNENTHPVSNNNPGDIHEKPGGRRVLPIIDILRCSPNHKLR